LSKKNNSRSYPFINPIIVSKNGKIVDGQHRYMVCVQKKTEVKYHQLDFSMDRVYDKEFIEQLRSIQAKQKKRLESFFKVKNIDLLSQLSMVSSEDRMEKFFEIEPFLLTDEMYWSYLGGAYTTSSNNQKHSRKIKKAFASNKKNRELVMSKEDRIAFNKLPQNLTIYRGMSVKEKESGDFGISWTLNQEVAKKFADRYIHNYDSIEEEHTLLKLVVNKKDVIAYFPSFDEEEIIYIHEK